MEPASRPWYKKKRYILPLGLMGLWVFAVASADTNSSQPSTITPTNPVYEQGSTYSEPSDNQIDSTYSDDTSDTEINSDDQTDEDTQTLNNDSTYINSDGDTIYSPTQLNNCETKGGTALCNDGSCSFSAHRQGTCSRHGGVSEWY